MEFRYPIVYMELSLGLGLVCYFLFFFLISFRLCSFSNSYVGGFCLQSISQFM